MSFLVSDDQKSSNVVVIVIKQVQPTLKCHDEKDLLGTEPSILLLSLIPPLFVFYKERLQIGEEKKLNENVSNCVRTKAEAAKCNDKR